MTANTAPTTDAATPERSQEIERLITVLEYEKKKHPNEDFWIWYIFGKPTRTLERLPSGTATRGMIAIRSNGLIYENDGEKWRIISHGLGAAMAWHHHTHPLCAIEIEDVADHISEAVANWLQVNWSNGSAYHVLDAITRRLTVNAEWTTLEHATHGITIAVHHIEVAMMESSHAEACGGVPSLGDGYRTDLLHGALQALHLAQSLLGCPGLPSAHAVNPTSKAPLKTRHPDYRQHAGQADSGYP